MSNRGAIKKTTDSKDVSKLRVQSRTKSRFPSDSTSDVQAKVETKDQKLLQSTDQRATGDRQRRTTQSVTSRNPPEKMAAKEKVKVLQNKPTRQTSVSINSKSNITASPRIASQTANRTSTLRMKSEATRKSGTINADRSKLKEKSNAGYSEKRGSSTVYMPKTARSGPSPKAPVQVEEPRISASGAFNEKNSSTEALSKPRVRQSSRERRKSRTLSPSEVKMLHAVMKGATASQKATVQGKVSGVKFSDLQKDEEDEYDYEDDFEDYESDFQECTESEVSEVSEETDSSRSSPELEPIEMRRNEQKKTINSAESRKTEEDQMLDSGHYELAEARKRAARVESLSTHQPKTPPLPELREPVNRSYRQEKQTDSRSLPMSTDEGFEDARSGDFAKSPPMSQISFIDFHKPKNDEVAKEESSEKSSRGQELLEMIKLDVVEWSLIECTPVAYEDFIRNYGKLDTQQMSVQTNEDNLEAETQTDAVAVVNKWTQFPVTCRRDLKNSIDLRMFKMEQIGVGDDVESETANSPLVPSYDILQLNEFLSHAGKVMLSLLEEKRFGGNVLRNDSHEFPFSEGFIKLSVESVTFLCDRQVSIIHYSETLSRVLLTIHLAADEGIETSSKQDYITDCCIGCVWSTSEPSRPTKLFYSSCSITACCFHSTNYNIVFAGLQDGTVTLWDLREDEMWHQKVTDKANEIDWILRSPTYTTASNIDDESHKSEVVAIRVLSKIEKDATTYSRLPPIQICTLDDEGGLIVWSMLSNMGKNLEDLGLAGWGNVRLVKSQQISIGSKKDKWNENPNGFVDMHVDSIDTNNLYLATNSSNIMRATCIGNKSHPSKHRGNNMEWSGCTTCIEKCPFEQPYFLVGCDDGTIRLHSPKVEKALSQLEDEQCSTAVRSLQWSRSNPCTIFVLDSESKIHVWDLSASDMLPISTTFSKKWGQITCMQLSPCKADRDMLNQYMALGTETGRVEIHKLNKDFSYSKKEDSEQQLNTFLRYASIL